MKKIKRPIVWNTNSVVIKDKNGDFVARIGIGGYPVIVTSTEYSVEIDSSEGVVRND